MQVAPSVPHTRAWMGAPRPRADAERQPTRVLGFKRAEVVEGRTPTIRDAAFCAPRAVV